MAKNKRKRVIGAGLVLVLGIVTAVQLLTPNIQIIDVEGTITWIDAEQRKGSLEFVLPRKKSKMTEKVCTIPADCELELNGSPISLEEIKAGDKADVKIRWDIEKKELTPLRIAVKREAE